MDLSPIVLRYLRQASSHERPSREEELEIVERARRKSPGAVDELLRRHIAFVVHVAMDYRDRGVPVEDLVHEGCLGLMKAVHRFDPANGARFMTYAGFWIRKAILDALADQPRTVHVPRYQRQKNQPIPREISLDTPLDANGVRTMGETLADGTIPPPGASIAERETVSQLRRHLRMLPLRERAVLASRYGLGGMSPMTLTELGSHLAVSRERVRQIESAALARLRNRLRRDQTSAGLRLAPSHR